MTNALITSSLFGGLFSDPDCAAPFGAQAFLAHILEVEAAWTRGLGVAGVIDDATAARILHAIAQIQPNPAALAAGAQRDGMVVPALIALIRADLPAEVRDVLHLGLTSQDVMDTGLVLCLRAALGVIEHRLQQIEAALEDLSLRWGAAPLMGRTRMQAAMPMRFAERLATWSQPVARHALRLDRLRPEIEVLSLGGAVGDRAALADDANAIAAEMAAGLGLYNPPKAQHAMRDHIAHYANLLSLVTGSLGKMGQDICLMAQQGIEEISLQGGGGSSAMPHKHNPILAELLVSNARFNATQLAGMHHALIHEHERSGAAWVLEWMILPQMAAVTARSLSAAQDLCARITRIG